MFTDIIPNYPIFISSSATTLINLISRLPASLVNIIIVHTGWTYGHHSWPVCMFLPSWPLLIWPWWTLWTPCCKMRLSRPRSQRPTPTCGRTTIRRLLWQTSRNTGKQGHKPLFKRWLTYHNEQKCMGVCATVCLTFPSVVILINNQRCWVGRWDKFGQSVR